MKTEEKNLKKLGLLLLTLASLCILFYAYNKLGNTLGDLIEKYYEY